MPTQNERWDVPFWCNSLLVEYLRVFESNFWKYFNSAFRLIVLLVNLIEISIRMKFTLECFLFTVIVTLVRATDKRCGKEPMFVPKYHPCHRTCEDYLNDKPCSSVSVRNIDQVCYCLPNRRLEAVLTDDGYCVPKERCKIYAEDPSLYY